MTKYGDTTAIQELAWGGAKGTLPVKVTAIQNQVTSLINIVLNRNEDFATVPEIIDQIANTVASEILRSSNTRQQLTTPQILDMIKVLSKGYMDQATEEGAHWGNVRLVY